MVLFISILTLSSLDNRPAIFFDTALAWYQYHIWPFHCVHTCNTLLFTSVEIRDIDSPDIFQWNKSLCVIFRTSCYVMPCNQFNIFSLSENRLSISCMFNCLDCLFVFLFKNTSLTRVYYAFEKYENLRIWRAELVHMKTTTTTKTTITKATYTLLLIWPPAHFRLHRYMYYINYDFYQYGNVIKKTQSPFI